MERLTADTCAVFAALPTLRSEHDDILTGSPQGISEALLLLPEPEVRGSHFGEM